MIHLILGMILTVSDPAHTFLLENGQPAPPLAVGCIYRALAFNNGIVTVRAVCGVMV